MTVCISLIEYDRYIPFVLYLLVYRSLQLLKSRTHNRRRWTHVFAPGEKEFQTIHTMPGPIWVSLSQPALLPLSIDFLPSRNVRAACACVWLSLFSRLAEILH